MNLADLLQIDRAGFPEHLKGAVPVPQNGLRTGDPGVIVTENTGVFLISRRIGGNFSQLYMVAGVGRCEQDDAVPGVKPFLHAFQRFLRLSVIQADSGHDTHSLRLNVDLPLVIHMASDRPAVRVIGTDKPSAVPSGSLYRLVHILYGLSDIGSFFRQVQGVTEPGVFLSVFDKHGGYENTFGNRPLAGTEGLKAFAGLRGKTVQVQAVVPVCPADLRQTVRTQMGSGEAYASAQMLHQRSRPGRIAVKSAFLVQNGEIPGFPYVGGCTGNQPERIVIKSAADVRISLFGKRLILVVCASVLKLCAGNIQDALPRTGGDQVDKAQQILAGIPESHSPAQPALKIAGTAAHIKGDHALILIPHIHKPVQFFIIRFD